MSCSRTQHSASGEARTCTIVNLTLDPLNKLTLCILMDFPIYTNTISMDLSILHLKGSQAEFSQLWCISVLEGCLILENSADTD